MTTTLPAAGSPSTRKSAPIRTRASTTRIWRRCRRRSAAGARSSSSTSGRTTCRASPGYTLAASLFITAGINGWWVFAAIILAGFFVNFLVNLTGKPSVKYGIPYAVMARSSMGVKGAQFPALIRGIVAIFWYGAQTYFASTAVALALNAIFLEPRASRRSSAWTSSTGSRTSSSPRSRSCSSSRASPGSRSSSTSPVPAVYVVMIALLVAIWVQAGDRLLPAVGSIFNNSSVEGWAAVAAFFGVIGTMIAYFSAVIINFGDFARFSRSEKAMRRGNFYGLPGEPDVLHVPQPVHHGRRVHRAAGRRGRAADEPGRDRRPGRQRVPRRSSRRSPSSSRRSASTSSRTSSRPRTTCRTWRRSASASRPAGTSRRRSASSSARLWVATISQIGLPMFVDTLGAILAPLYGVLVADYYIVQRRSVKVADLFSMDESGRYFYQRGWNVRALIAIGDRRGLLDRRGVGPELKGLSGFAWVIGAVLGAVLYTAVMWSYRPKTAAVAPARRTPRSIGLMADSASSSVPAGPSWEGHSGRRRSWSRTGASPMSSRSGRRSPGRAPCWFRTTRCCCPAWWTRTCTSTSRAAPSGRASVRRPSPPRRAA